MICQHCFIDCPGPPKDLKVSKIDENEITIEWRPPSKDGGSRVKKYQIYIKSESTEDKWINIATVDSFKTYFTILKLEPKNKYYIGVTAVNEVGEGGMAETDKTYSPKQPISKFVCDQMTFYVKLTDFF